MFSLRLLVFCVYVFHNLVNGQIWDIYEDLSCITPDDKYGTCIVVKNCRFMVETLRNLPKPLSATTIEWLQQYQCGYEGTEPRVCCPSGVPERTTATPQWNQHLINGDNCGRILPSDKIYGGRKTGWLEFPWMALISYSVDDRLTYQCGGSLINSHYVLTAAHCITGLRDRELAGVRLGEHNIDTRVDCDEIQVRECAPPVQDVAIKKVIVHPNYSRRNLINDIGLIRLEQPANIQQENIQPICLPESQRRTVNLTGKKLLVAGWGATEKGYSSPELLKVSLPYVENVGCAEQYSRLGRPARIGTVEHLCAGGVPGKDTCIGDSGGPLINAEDVTGKGDIRFIQRGIVSFGFGKCGVDPIPGIYVRLENYVDWILDVVTHDKD